MHNGRFLCYWHAGILLLSWRRLCLGNRPLIRLNNRNGHNIQQTLTENISTRPFSGFCWELLRTMAGCRTYCDSMVLRKTFFMNGGDRVDRKEGLIFPKIAKSSIVLFHFWEYTMKSCNVCVIKPYFQSTENVCVQLQLYALQWFAPQHHYSPYIRSQTAFTTMWHNVPLTLAGSAPLHYIIPAPASPAARRASGWYILNITLSNNTTFVSFFSHFQGDSPFGKTEAYIKLEQLGEGSYATVFKGYSK